MTTNITPNVIFGVHTNLKYLIMTLTQNDTKVNVDLYENYCSI